MKHVDEFNFAKEVIYKANDIVLSYFGKHPKITKVKGSYFSTATQADDASEQFIRKELSLRFPEYGFIGEETKENVKDTSWIVDPLDGTSAFLRGLPDFGLVIALKVKNALVFSLQYHCISKVLFYAIRNGGAFKNGGKISVSDTSEINRALISIGAETVRVKRHLDLLSPLIVGNRIRIGHSSVLEGSFVANGNIDALIKFDQHIWDAAPACFIIQEAGGVVTNKDGTPLEIDFSRTDGISYIAGNAVIHDKIIETLNKNG